MEKLNRREFLIKSGALTAVTASALALAGCGAKPEETTPKDTVPATTAAGTDEKGLADVSQMEVVSGVSDEMLTIAMDAEPTFIMPNSGRGGNSNSFVIDCMDESMFGWDPATGETVPILAESYEWIDQTHFRVKMREGVKFANGEEMTAEDAVYSMQLALTLASGTPVYVIDSFKAVDKYTWECETNGVWASACPDKLCRSSKVYSKKALEANGPYVDNMVLEPDAANPQGTGKYKFVEWVPGSHVLLERNDNYWNQENLGYYKYIKFVFVSDSAARAMAVESGDADVGVYVPCSMGEAYEDSDLVTPWYVDSYMAGVVFLNMNNPDNQDSPLKNEKVREAIWNLIDVEALNDLANAGKGTYNDTTISTASWVYKPCYSERKVDIEKAKALLAEAGYPNGFTLNTTNIPAYKPQGEVVKECLRMGGIELNITANEIPAHFALLREGKFDVIFSSLNACDFTENIRLVDGRISYATVAGGCGYTGDDTWAAICDRCYSETEPEARKQAFYDAQDYMAEHYLAIGTCSTVKLELVKKGLSAPVINASGVCEYHTIKPLA